MVGSQRFWILLCLAINDWGQLYGAFRVFEVRYPGESGGCQAESAALPALTMLAEDAEVKYGDNLKWSGTLKGCSGLRHTWSEVAGSLSGRSGLRLIHLPPTVPIT